MLFLLALNRRSLFTGDSGRTPTNQAPSRPPHDLPRAVSLSNGQARSRLSLRGLLVVLALISQLSALSSSCRATELTDLGEGLSYLRIHAIDESAKGLTAAVRERKFLVLDLRHANTTVDSAEMIRTALASRDFKQPVFILVGPATPSAIVNAFAPVSGKYITFGVKESLPAPQVIVDQPAATDRLAYEALEAGRSLTSLISGKISKDRFDESVLMKEFNSGIANAEPLLPSDPTAKPANPKKLPVPAANATEKNPTVPGEISAAPGAKGTEPAPAELTDRVLQRAVHLHRAFLALKTRSS